MRRRSATPSEDARGVATRLFINRALLLVRGAWSSSCFFLTFSVRAGAFLDRRGAFVRISSCGDLQDLVDVCDEDCGAVPR
jgi:hypothetical protein